MLYIRTSVAIIAIGWLFYWQFYNKQLNLDFKKAAMAFIAFIAFVCYGDCLQHLQKILFLRYHRLPSC